jgi:putative intracellular protease/amidase
MTLSTISFTTGPVSARLAPHSAGGPIHDYGYTLGKQAISPSIPSPFFSIITVPPDNSQHLLIPLSTGPETTATHTFLTAPALDIILIPGGTGIFALEQANSSVIETFITQRYTQADYILSVSFGAVPLARAGLLKGKRATTNKSGWTWATNKTHGEGIEWVPQARWVEDGKSIMRAGRKSGGRNRQVEANVT